MRAADDQPCVIRVEVSPGVHQILHVYFDVGPDGELTFQTVESREWSQQMHAVQRSAMELADRLNRVRQGFTFELTTIVGIEEDARG